LGPYPPYAGTDAGIYPSGLAAPNLAHRPFDGYPLVSGGPPGLSGTRVPAGGRLTGDFFTEHLKARAAFAATLQILSDAAPTFACPGNHDGGLWAGERGGPSDLSDLERLLREAGIRLLENRDTLLDLPAGRILIGGLGDIWAARCDPEPIRADYDTSTAPLKILLTHNPDSKAQAADIRWDLLLAGHTHGGQLALPFVGTPFAPVKDKRFVNGLYPYEGRLLHISPGVGNLHGMRFNCRPEISVLDLSR
jgi:predicted MPP superfamily phosphohydrolase